MTETPENSRADIQAPQPEGRGELPLIAKRSGLFGPAGSGDTSGFGGLVTELYEPAPTERPLGGWFDEVADILIELITEAGLDVESVIEKFVVGNGQLVIYVSADYLPTVCQMLRDDQDLRFELCLGVSGVHYPQATGRELRAHYSLFSITHSRQLQLEVACSDAHPHIPSAVSVYPGIDWHERETWDLMGIVFDGHPALTRTAMPDDWVGHPQRKDYPLGGIPVEYKGATVPPPDTRRSYR